MRSSSSAFLASRPNGCNTAPDWADLAAALSGSPSLRSVLVSTDCFRRPRDLQLCLAPGLLSLNLQLEWISVEAAAYLLPVVPQLDFLALSTTGWVA